MVHNLNLSRKWRPRTFQEVVGQDVAIGMLRNSLYKNHFFPLYLFAGQKGCGKTSTARILAAAANCTKLGAFQQDPTANPVPCLVCDSCLRMQQGSHADFIEIDAASHTGVDDVRALLESCNFMPLMGTRKIYLIDEAHMLSKAAFNAFLKILEEPPAHTIFMLATTEILKIPDTVRSRSFQLHFSAIQNAPLAQHLQSICVSEQITYQPEALTLIISETDGSARDALNLLEQVRFAHTGVTAEAVRTVLGVMSAGRMAELFALMIEKKTTELLSELNVASKTNLNAARVWHLLLQVVRTLIWQSYAVTPAQENLALPAEIASRIMAAAPREYLHQILNHLWTQEELFLNTPYKHVFLEKLFLDICTGLPTVAAPQRSAAPANSVPSHTKPVIATAPTPKPIPTASPKVQLAPVETKVGGWSTLCLAISKIGDPILSSIFNQAEVAEVNTTTGVVTLTVTHASPFFMEKINETNHHWRPLLQAHFENCSTIRLAARSAAAPAKVEKEGPRQQNTTVATQRPIAEATPPPVQEIGRAHV